MKIEKAIYQGYIWYSDRSEPEVKDNQVFELEIDDCVNPFVVEGQLYDSDNNVSLNIRYVDGKHICTRYDVENLTGEISVDVFCSNKMDGRKLKFAQYWRLEPDPLCEGMNVLQPKECVFMGFEK